MCEWLHPKVLCLSSGILDAATIRLLSLGNWPNLESLHLDRNSLSACDIEELVKGNWHKLQSLHLCNNHLDAAAMVHLANGSWPLLKRLSLARNHLDVKALQNLIQGACFELETLDLSRNTIGEHCWGIGLTDPCCDAAIAVLRGDSDIVLKAGKNWLSPAKQLGYELWPKMRFLNLSNFKDLDSSCCDDFADIECYPASDE